MVRIDYYLFGYRVIDVKEECLCAFTTLLLRHGICARIGDGRGVIIKESDYRQIKEKLSDLTLSTSQCYGLRYAIAKIKSRPGIALALVFTLALYIFSYDLVWEVRIFGNVNVRREEIIEELSKVGFGVGSRWSRCDKERIELELLEDSENISWISINRTGCIANVNVIEKHSDEKAPQDNGYSNLIAAKDGVIEEIRVTRGYPTVKVGDTVKAGDLLISGIIPDELGGGICHAEGVVMARVYTEASVSVSKNEGKKVYGESELYSVSLKIFNFSLNIFKKYGNIEEGCDIIEDVEDFVVLGKYRLPIAISKKYTQAAEIVNEQYTDAEVVKIAVFRMQKLLVTALSGMDLISIRTEGAFSDGEYTLISKMTVVTDIGESRRLTD